MCDRLVTLDCRMCSKLGDARPPDVQWLLWFLHLLMRDAGAAAVTLSILLEIACDSPGKHVHQIPIVNAFSTEFLCGRQRFQPTCFARLGILLLPTVFCRNCINILQFRPESAEQIHPSFSFVLFFRPLGGSLQFGKKVVPPLHTQ